MKIIAISDTHGQHHGMDLPEGDMIIHAGDVSRRGTKSQVVDFLHWYAQLDYPHKILIAGNHDFYFEEATPDEIADIMPSGIHYLNDSGVRIEGIHIWGSPVQPWFHDWAFNRQRGGDIKRHWDLIPADTDILVTHGPPLGILDKTVFGDRVGCADLMDRVGEVKPKFHIFGHIHEAYGVLERDGVTYVNASVLNFRYQIVNLSPDAPALNLDYP